MKVETETDNQIKLLNYIIIKFHNHSIL